MNLPTDRALALVLLAAPLAWIVGGSILYLVRSLVGSAPPEDEETRRRGASLLLGPRLRQVFTWVTDPLVVGLSRIRVSPNFLTVLSVAISFGAAALLAAGWLATGGVVALLGSSLDFLDGKVARRTGRSTSAGAFLDSTLDRWSDLALFGGVAILERENLPMLLVVLVATGSTLLVSYTRARAESLGASLTAGLMQRPERIVALCLGAILSPYAAGFWRGPHPDRVVLEAVLVVVALLTLGTAIRRTVLGFRRLEESGEGPAGE